MRRRGACASAATATALALAGCSLLRPPPPPQSPPAEPEPRAEAPRCDEAVFQRAQRDRSSHLELEVQRLRADLDEAEAAMLAIESGLRNSQTRADAVSALAETRIVLQRAADGAPWRRGDVQEARDKLAEAERQLEANHAGTAVFFASRARRIAETLDEEARRVAGSPSARFIRARRVNLRAGPGTDHTILDVLEQETPVLPERPEGDWVLVRTLSGRVGWVHGGLLR